MTNGVWRELQSDFRLEMQARTMRLWRRFHAVCPNVQSNLNEANDMAVTTSFQSIATNERWAS